MASVTCIPVLGMDCMCVVWRDAEGCFNAATLQGGKIVCVHLNPSLIAHGVFVGVALCMPNSGFMKSLVGAVFELAFQGSSWSSNQMDLLQGIRKQLVWLFDRWDVLINNSLAMGATM